MGGIRLRGPVAAALLVAAATLALVLASVPAPAAASVTTITVISGSASFTRGGAAVGAVSGDLVRAGDEVRTSADGHAVLTFVDGSTMTLEPGAVVVVEEATSRQGSVVIRVFQTLGLTWSSVSHLLSPASRFDVRSPSVTASVRGTAFELEVSADGATRVRTAEGTVAVANGRGEVLVGEGEETRAAPGDAPAPPSAPPPATRRTLEIGDRAVLVIDAAGRGCGQHAGRVVEQIPGCVVRDGTILIVDADRVGAYRLAVTEDVGTDTRVVERTTLASATAETVRTVELPEAELGVPPVQVAAAARPTFEVTLPIIGTIPVQVDLATASPAGAVSVSVPATAGPDRTPDPFVPLVSLPPIPVPGTATPTPAVVPSIAPIATALATVLPTATVAPLPTVSLATASPTPARTAAPTPTPTPTPILAVPSLLPSPTPTPTTPTPTPAPEPTAEATPTPTPAPTPTPTPVPPPTAPSNAQASVLLGTVTVTWDPSSTLPVTYEVGRGPCNGTATMIAPLALSPYADAPGTGSFFYQIRAVGTDGQKSGPASTTCVSVP